MARCTRRLSDGRRTMHRLSVGSESFFRHMGALVEATGRDDFHARLVEFAAMLLDCDRWLVMRYGHYAMPEFVVNEAMSEEAIAFYLKGIYRLDPLLRISRNGSRRGVYTLGQLKGREGDSAYYDDIFRTALIYDELAILFPAPGRVCVALCLDRDSRRFAAHEVRTIERLYPTLEGLHNAHLDRTFAAALNGAIRAPLGQSQQAILILDRHDHPVFRSEGWQALERAGAAPDLRLIHANRASGMVSLDANTVLHWEELGPGFAVAPQGRVCVVERRSPGYVGADFREALARFAERHALTPQQRSIVELIMRGHPNASIASRLRISAGTVRNHRCRLYDRLDITTERELFHLFLRELFAADQPAPPPARALVNA